LIKAFFSGLQTGQLKLETRRHGFTFLEEILAGGVELEYGQLADGLIHKYKLLNVGASRLDGFLQGHVAGDYNVCGYFSENGNNLCCFNVDDNLRSHDYQVSTEPMLEVRLGMDALLATLNDLGLTPLVVLSGRGYHVWLRFREVVANPELYKFSIRVAARALAVLHPAGADYRRIKIGVYPHPEIIHTGSLRLFGSKHVRSGVFTHVLRDGHLLSEAASWDYFAACLREGTIPTEHFREVAERLAQPA